LIAVKEGNATSAGWQVTLCDGVWDVSSRSGEACLRTAIHPREDRRENVGVSLRLLYRNKFRKSRVSDVSAKILARMSASASASWNSSFRLLILLGC